MKINFDEPINRLNSNSLKWDNMKKLYGVDPKDGLAMWVADMDFKAPPEVNECIKEIGMHGVHGYFGDDQNFKKAMRNWMKKRHDWDIRDEWSSETNGLGSAISIAIRAFSDPGDEIILFSPVYYSFARIIKANNRVIKEFELDIADGRYTFNLSQLQKGLSGKEKILVFCSPHNPGGRVWTKKELQEIAKFCIENDLILLCDEIHAELTYPKNVHHTLLKAAPYVKSNALVMVSTTKPFNLSGGQMGSVIIPDTHLRGKFDSVHEATGKMQNKIGMKMAEAAYLHGEPWLDKLIHYLENNKRCLDEGLETIKGFKSMPLESTYLAWISYKNTGLTPKEFYSLLFKKAKIAANVGSTFGKGGDYFFRMNFACRRAIVEEAVERLQKTFC